MYQKSELKTLVEKLLNFLKCKNIIIIEKAIIKNIQFSINFS